MEDRDQLNNIIRNIVSEVLRECKNRQINVTAEFIDYYIQLLRLDPNRDLTVEHLTRREKVQNFVRYLVSTFEKKNDPQIIALRLQHQFRVSFDDLEYSVHQFRKKLDLKLYPLLLEIIEQSSHNTGEVLYRKITYYVTLASGLGNPHHKDVYKEAIQVVKSVLDPIEIEIFPSIQNYIKQELVKCMVDITTGIRLYNKSCRKGGEEITDIPKLMEDGIKAVRDKFEDCIETSLYRAKVVTRFVEKHMVIRHIKNQYMVDLDFKTTDEKVRWGYMRDMALTYRQLIKITRVLLEYITDLDNNRKRLNEMFQDTIKTLNGTIIPTLYQAITEVFPHFTELANIWKSFQDDAVRLREVYNLFNLQSETIFSMEFDASWENEPPYLEKWVMLHDNPSIQSSETNVTVHRDTEGFSRKDLEFNGYCCWVLTQAQGVLIPATISLGVIEYNDKFYGFSSKMAASCFAYNPEEYIMKTIEVARERVHLIKFLNLGDTMEEHTETRVLVKKEEKPKIMVHNAEAQTDTHFQESDSDGSYFWNVWDYKRSLLKNRDIKNKITKATETIKTYQKENHHTQTYDLVNTDTQTRRDNYTSTKKPLRYIYGLRGVRGNYPFVMDLTEPQSYNQVPKKFSNKEYN